MSTGHLHLFKRAGRYWWRRRLPARLGAALGIAQVRRSLHTADPSAARRRARRASVAFDGWLAIVEKNMTEGRRAPTQDELKGVLDDLLEKVLADGERRRAQRPPGPPDWMTEGPDDPDDEEQMREAEERAREAAPTARIPELRELLVINDCKAVLPDLDAVLAVRGR